MADKPRALDESIVVSGSSARAVVERVLIASRGVKGCAATQPSEHVVQIAESSRRLLGRRSGVCTVTVMEEPQRLIVTMHGVLTPSLSASIKAAIAGRATNAVDLTAGSFRPAAMGTAGALSSFVPPTDWLVSQVPSPVAPAVVFEDGATIARPSMRGAQGQHHPAATRAVRSMSITLADGRAFSVDGLALLGRNPSPTPEAAAPVLIRLDDAECSKTHAAIGRTGELVWIEDRHSTNGTSLVDALGRTIAVPAGERFPVQLPQDVVVGSTRISVAWS